MLRKPFLFLYDTIPGGTGYLRELLRDPNNFFSVFEKALIILRACDCNDGCYNCLYGYRNSFDQDQTSRRTAIDLLNTIVSHRHQLTETQGALSQVKLNALFDSQGYFILKSCLSVSKPKEQSRWACAIFLNI
ncbi:DUF1998 domain-containing protein [Nostoc sp.]|uniref:DUF1998 domain-containing protein n=1 Tax=Nostoc sp. TaxID=1180 RepID=UPI003FA6020D